MGIDSVSPTSLGPMLTRRLTPAKGTKAHCVDANVDVNENDLVRGHNSVYRTPRQRVHVSLTAVFPAALLASQSCSQVATIAATMARHIARPSDPKNNCPPKRLSGGTLMAKKSQHHMGLTVGLRPQLSINNAGGM